MGLPSDAEELMGKAMADVRHRKLMRVLWGVATSLGTIVATTATVTWKVNDYLHEAREAQREIAGKVLVLDKHLEGLEERCDAVKKVADEAKVQADKAMLYAQLTGQRNGVAKP